MQTLLSAAQSLARPLFLAALVAVPAAPVLAQSRATVAQSRPLPAPADTLAPVPGNLRVEWEVKNRFRLFRNEADFNRHTAASRGDGVLAAEQRLARATDGRGWARDMVGNLCIDQSGKIPETCQRDGERENFMAPADHRIGVGIVGAVPAGALCAWTFDDKENAPKQMTAPCTDPIKLSERYGVTTLAAVDVG